MYHPKRPTPTSYMLAGGICGVGTVSVIARGFHNFTDFTIHEPFNGITFAIAAGYAIVGPLMGAWLAAATYRRRNAALLAEIAELRAERQAYATLKEAIEKVDAQAEVTTVLTRKVLKAVEESRANEDTQDIPRPRTLHGINGGGGA